MPVEILSMTHDLTTLLFGIYISAFFLGVRQNYKNTGILFYFFAEMLRKHLMHSAKSRPSLCMERAPRSGRWDSFSAQATIKYFRGCRPTGCHGG